MTRPPARLLCARPLFAAALVWLLLGALAFFFPAALTFWALYGILALPLLSIDAVLVCHTTDRLTVTRSVASSLALGQSAKVNLTLTRGERGRMSAHALLFDLYPDSMTCGAFPASINTRALADGGIIHFDYEALPVGRGEWSFAGVQLLLASPLRFWRLKVTHPCLTCGRTYPDFKKIRKSAGVDVLLENSGAKNIRKRGQGLEFLSLREYQSGDSVRALDWRATSRRQKAIVRDYQDEQDQQVLFLLDSGYRLHRTEGAHLQFDTALNAALLLSHTALKYGDSVAAGVFGASERWIPPRKGVSALPRLMNALYDVTSASVPSSPFSALENALERLHRRTFILLISNFREEDGESLSWILPRVQRRHLLLLVSLRELEAESLAAAPDDSHSIESAAAFAYLASRRKLYQTWEHAGLLTLESTADALSGDLVKRYLDVKKSGRL